MLKFILGLLPSKLSGNNIADHYEDLQQILLEKAIDSINKKHYDNKKSNSDEAKRTQPLSNKEISSLKELFYKNVEFSDQIGIFYRAGNQEKKAALKIHIHQSLVKQFDKSDVYLQPLIQEKTTSFLKQKYFKHIASVSVK